MRVGVREKKEMAGLIGTQALGKPADAELQSSAEHGA